MILDLLQLPSSSIPYAALTALHQQTPGWFILETIDANFAWQQYADENLCTFTPIVHHLEQALYSWFQSENKPYRFVANGYFEVNWQGQTLRLLQIQYESSCGISHRVWICSQDETLARNFFASVCRWNTAVRHEVYVYEEGTWYKNSELFKSIQSSRFENLILPPGLKETIREDAVGFFASHERYRRVNVPWKRGLILIGPPGNGKTHLIQALINELNKPCLYVKSLKSRYQNEDRSIREVFEKARETAPCILVMEDIDAMIDQDNRSFFLNELDGFRKNEGLLTIATTNHPEKLDPAIVDRPSRFDRKYHFELPALGERMTYLHWWNQRFDPSMRLTNAGIDSVAAATEGFSFAYLKELALASSMAWMNRPNATMNEIMAAQLIGLCEQMASVVSHSRVQGA